MNIIESYDRILSGTVLINAYWNTLPYRYRRGPVPLVGLGRFKFGGYRHPKTLGLLKAATEVRDSLTPPLRQKVKTIPTCYDDISRQHTRSWKSYRKTQWRPVTL